MFDQMMTVWYLEKLKLYYESRDALVVSLKNPEKVCKFEQNTLKWGENR